MNEDFCLLQDLISRFTNLEYIRLTLTNNDLVDLGQILLSSQIKYVEFTNTILLKSDLLDIKTFIEHNAEQLSSRGLTIDVGRVDDVMCEAGLEKLKADFQEFGVTVECKSADIKSSKLCFDKG